MTSDGQRAAEYLDGARAQVQAWLDSSKRAPGEYLDPKERWDDLAARIAAFAREKVAEAVREPEATLLEARRALANASSLWGRSAVMLGDDHTLTRLAENVYAQANSIGVRITRDLAALRARASEGGGGE